MKDNKYYELIKNFGVLTLGSFSSKVLIFLLVPIYTAILSTEEYGFFDLTLTTIQLILPIITLNIVDGLLRFALDKHNDFGETFNICNKFTIISCGEVIIILLFFTLVSGDANIKKYSVCIFLYYFFYAYNSLFLQAAKALDKVKAIAIAGIISAVSLFGLTILLLKVVKWGLMGFYIANIVSQMLTAIYYLFSIKPWKHKKNMFRADSKMQRNIIEYSLPLLVTTLCWWVNSSSDRYVVSFFCGIGASGLLSVAYKIPNIISTITGVFTQAWQISAIKEYDGNQGDTFYINTFVYLNLFVCIIVAFTIPTTRFISKILFAENYYMAWKFVPFLLVSTIFNVGSGFLGPILNAGYNVKTVAKSGLYGMFINIILNIIFTYLVGAQGVTIATIISSFVIYFIRKRAAKEIICGKKYFKIVIVWIMIIFSAVIYTYIEITWISFIIFICVLMAFYDEIRRLLMVFIKDK